MKTYRNNGTISKRPRDGNHSSKVDDEMMKQLITGVEEKPTIALNEMLEKLASDAPQKPTVSLQTISRALDAELISVKDSRFIPEQWNLVEYKKGVSNG